MQFKKVLVSILVSGSIVLTAQATWGQTYYVKSGDSLYTIAARYGTTAAALQQANGLSSTEIYPGQALKIATGGAGKNSNSGSGSSYTVRAGDTLYLLSQRYGVSIDALRSANNLSGNSLMVGQQLIIPTSSGSGSGTTYRVQAGDTLYLIAQRYGTTVAALQSANGISGTNLQVGQSLKIPAGGSSNPGSSGTTYTVQSGDSLYLIAQKYGTTVDALRQANNLSGDSLSPGQTLQIPGSPSGNSGTSYYNYTLSQNDLDLLARLVTAESDGEPFSGQVAVAATILNRLRDSRYPKTISGIIYQVDNGSYQYSPVLDGRINLAASSSAIRAVQSAVSGWDPSYGANGFYNPDKTTNQWVRSHPVTTVIGNHVFFSY
ncbi:LysM domain-containing protein [Hydrogenispora ethanolica]|uniref:LysM domain-containing protein n=1 Tax=Hydrogenispora ethanolica TaxID=1082276 RepID=A0A4V2QFF3_HYDET|nr:LysM peptidoglycan-binding domain-containing protein [Hydrogenispora ethanolica]TCL71677.1 LysM domain-containing protein [Hydrogenispora ethanolica]